MEMGWIIRRILEAVAVKPVPLWESTMIKVPADAALGDVIFDAGDAIGPVDSFEAPVSGTLDLARLYDRANLGTQFNIALFYTPLVLPPVSDAAFAPVDLDVVKLLYILEFTTFKSFTSGANQFSSLDHLGVDYKLTPLPNNPTKGQMFFQAYSPVAQTHVLGSEPLFTISVKPDQPVRD